MIHSRLILALAVCLFLTARIHATDPSSKLDFDGDGRTDLALYREGSRDILTAPNPSYWYFLNTHTGAWRGVHWGSTLDVPSPGDFDNDGITDFGVFRWWDFESGDVNQYWLSRSTGGYQVLAYEWQPSYYKFNRNYMGDGRTEIGQLYQINISQDPGNRCLISVYFVGDEYENSIIKTVGDACNVTPTPVPGDYNNDGMSEIAVFNNGTFKVWFPPYDPTYTAPNITQFMDVDAPAPGDYDGDGKTDFAGTKGVAGRLIWRIRSSITGTIKEVDFGYATDTPVPGDYDGDGKTDIAVWRASDTTWWIMYSGSSSVAAWQFGLPTDTPLATPVIAFDPSS